MIITGKSIFFFLICIAVFISARKNRDIFSPIKLYLITYSLTLGITCLNLSPYSQNWQALTWQILAISALAYILGVLSVYSFAVSRKVESFDLVEIKEKLKISYLETNPKKLLAGILVCFVGYFIVFFWGTISIGTVPVFARDPNQARIDFAFFGSAANFIGLSEVVVLLSLSILFAGQKKYRFAYVLFILTVATSSSLLLTRILVLKILFISILLYRYFRGPLNWKITFSVVVLFLIIFIGAFVLRSKGDFFKNEEYKGYTLLKIKKGYELISLPYAYVANNYWNLNYGLSLVEESKFRSTFGLRTFHAIFQLAKQGKTMEKAFEVEDFLDLEIQKIPPFNTVAYHWNLYRDFGFFGIVLGSFIMGAVMSVLYLLLRAKPNWWHLNLYGSFAFFLALSFFGSLWYHLASWITPACMYVLYIYSKKRKYKQPQEC